jgi:hypothetical protein
MRKHYTNLIVSLLVSLVFSGLLFAQRADRITITGLVTDPSGLAVPEASVTVTDEATNVTATTATTGDGNYVTPPLILGTYTVVVEKQGFKVFRRTGISMAGGTIYRQDIKLELGTVTQSVEVKGTARMINLEQGDVSHSLNAKYYEDLPVVMGGDMRLAEALLQAQPGYVPGAPTGDPIFRGSGFNSRINGGQTMGTENFLDGASFGCAISHNLTHEGAPPFDSIREMKVIQNSYSAQYSRTSGGYIEYTTKSGTAELHGSAYYYMANTALDARGEFLPERTKLINNNPGFTLGGPILIPKVYDGRKKTFFFTNFDSLHVRQGALAGYTNTVAIPAMRTGDFSSLLGTVPTQLTTDVLGRPVYEGEIFDPSTTRLVNGTPVRDGYGFDPVTGLPIQGSANIIPNCSPGTAGCLRSQVAAGIINRLPSPDRSGFPYNGVGELGDPRVKLDVPSWLLRVDHEFTPSFKMSTTYFYDYRPGIGRCGGPGGCKTTNDGISAPEQNSDYIGTGFVQKISTKLIHQQFDWLVRPNVFNHTTIAFDRWLLTGISLANGVGWNNLLGIKGIPYDEGGPPLIQFSGVTPYSTLGDGIEPGGQTANRWQFNDDITWITGRHTFKTGFEYRHHQLPLFGYSVNRMGTYNFDRIETGGYDALGNTLPATGDAFGSMLLGQVHNANFIIPEHTTWYQNYYSPWVNDEIKLTPKLTITLGVRFDYQTANQEAHDRYSTFDPTVPNPGAGGHLGAIAFAGTGPARTGRRTFETPKRDGWGPRFGLAYKLNERNVLRGGYGIYYGGVNWDQFAATPNIGFSTNPTASNLTNGLFPAYFWDDPFPQNLVSFPPVIDPTIANGAGPVAVANDGLTLPRYQSWSLTYERQITGNLSLDLSYIGNHATRLPANATHGLGELANMNNPDVLALGANVLQADINSPEAQAAGISTPYPGFSGNVAHALRLFPQYELIDYRTVPIAWSIYHALQVTMEKRFSNNFQARIGYTWSKLMNVGAESALSHASGTIQNPIDYQKGERGLSSDDVPHLLFLAYTFQFPFGPGQKFAAVSGPFGKAIGGWGVSAIQRYQAGRPLNISMDNNLGGFLFNSQKRPNKVGPGVMSDRSGFDPNKDVYLLQSGWADPGALNFGNAPRTDATVRWFPEYSEDFNVYKNTKISEKVNVRFQAAFGNAFNRHFYCPANTNWSSPSFGQVFAQCDVPRRIQFALEVKF